MMRIAKRLNDNTKETTKRAVIKNIFKKNPGKIILSVGGVMLAAIAAVVIYCNYNITPLPTDYAEPLEQQTTGPARYEPLMSIAYEPDLTCSAPAEPAVLKDAAADGYAEYAAAAELAGLIKPAETAGFAELAELIELEELIEPEDIKDIKEIKDTGDTGDIREIEVSAFRYYQYYTQYKWVSLGEYTLVAYCPCVLCCGIWSVEHPSRRDTGFVQRTASGTIPEAERTIAVNPAVIPFGTKVLINGHVYIAEDTGAAPRRGRLIDIFKNCHYEALRFGRQSAEIWIKKFIQ